MTAELIAIYRCLEDLLVDLDASLVVLESDEVESALEVVLQKVDVLNELVGKLCDELGYLGDTEDDDQSDQDQEDSSMLNNSVNSLQLPTKAPEEDEK